MEASDFQRYALAGAESAERVLVIQLSAQPQVLSRPNRGWGTPSVVLDVDSVTITWPLGNPFPEQRHPLVILTVNRFTGDAYEYATLDALAKGDRSPEWSRRGRCELQGKKF